MSRLNEIALLTRFVIFQVFKGPVLKIATASVDSNVVDTDIVASNGVIHTIDTVL